MGALNGNYIWIPDAKDPVELHVTAGIVAAAASDAIGGDGAGTRRPITFVAANQTEKVAIDSLHPGGLIDGDQVFVVDTQWYETFGATGWKVTRTLLGLSYTPDLVAGLITIGNGATDLRYWINGDEITVAGLIYLGTTGVLDSSGPCWIPLPLPAALSGVNNRVLGTVGACLPAGGLGYIGQIVGVDAAGFVKPFLYSKFPDQSISDPGRLLGYANYTPRAWGTGTANRMFSVVLTYTRA